MVFSLKKADGLLARNDNCTKRINSIMRYPMLSDRCGTSLGIEDND